MVGKAEFSQNPLHLDPGLWNSVSERKNPAPYTPSILLVDDEDEVRGSFHRVLEELGYYIVEAANGRQAENAVGPVLRPGRSGSQHAGRGRYRIDPQVSGRAAPDQIPGDFRFYAGIISAYCEEAGSVFGAAKTCV